MKNGFICDYCYTLENVVEPIMFDGLQFCSEKCNKQYLKSLKSKAKTKVYKSNIKWKICSICDSVHLNEYDYCSTECNLIYCIDHGCMVIQTNVLHKCRYCGNFIGLDKSFCNADCTHKFFVGSNAPSWKGGISFEPYCPKFNDDLKMRVRAFFVDECFLCGRPAKFENRALSIHHVTYNKKMCCDGTKPLFVPLCSSCHGMTNSNREYWQRIITKKLKAEYSLKCYYTKKELGDLITYIESL